MIETPSREAGPVCVPAPAGRSARRGIALVLTLLVLSILLILVVQLRLTTRLHVIQSANTAGDLRNLYGARAGLEFARLYVQTDTELTPGLDMLHEPWARPIQIPGLSDVSVQLVLEDEERRFNLFRLVLPNGKPDPVGREQLARLVAILGIPEDTLALRIADYIDPDTEGDFEAGARNRMLVIPEELAMIPGIYPEFLYGGVDPRTEQPYRGILEYVTLWPVPIAPPPVPTRPDAQESSEVTPPAPDENAPPPAEGTTRPPNTPRRPPVAAVRRPGVNLNTVLPEVLLALCPEMTPEVAQAVAAYRTGTEDDGTPRAFKSIADLYRVPGITERMVDALKGEVVFKSSIFSARVVSRSGNVSRRVRYVLGRGAATEPPPLLTWWEEGGAFGMPRAAAGEPLTGQGF